MTHVDPPTEWAALDAALDHALDLDPAGRVAYLAMLNAETAARLTVLLRDAIAEDPILDNRRSFLDPFRHDPTPSVGGGDRVGPYEIESLVGEGGMGRVYRAHRVDGAFDQTVAVKVVRTSLSLAGSDVVPRLRQERALLATLDHPGIARLIDGGETADGVPYLVTEFIDGEPLTTWAETRGLDVASRVRLVREVARAVDHAHRRFVVHRDLKPSNVLVTERDGVPRPVVLDFGIAKLIESADAKTDFPLTRTGFRMLTPAYAAPELFESGAPVTTAADVYGLGAVLYELLTGSRAHPGAGSAPARGEPTRPSVLVATQASPNPAETTRRARALRGDLDTICLKALHLDPARRYASAAELADDLDRHLEGRPVEARPDSVGYVVGRFARRHRSFVAAVAVAVAALVGGLSVAVVSLEHERVARAEAEASAARASEAAGLLAGLFQAADPSDDSGGRDVTARQALDAGVTRVTAVESPGLRGELLSMLGQAYVGLGEVVVADSLLRLALPLLEGDGVASPTDLARTRILLASTRMALSDPARARALAQQVLDDFHDVPAHPSALAGMRAMVASSLMMGETDRALRVAQRAVAATRASGDREGLSRALNHLATVRLARGDARGALAVADSAHVLSVALFGRDHLRTYTIDETRAEAFGALGRPDDTVRILRERIAYQDRVFGPNSLTVAYALADIGAVEGRRQRPGRAAAAYDSAFEIGQRHLPSGHADLAAWKRSSSDTNGRPR